MLENTSEFSTGDQLAENLKENQAILTPEDRRRLGILFQEMGDGSLESWEDGSIDFRLRLRDEGKKAAQYICEDIKSILDGAAQTVDSENNTQLWLDLCRLKYCMASENAAVLNSLLKNEKLVIAFNNRSKKIQLSELLEFFGTPENIHDLLGSTMLSINASYLGDSRRSFFAYLDCDATITVLFAILARNNNDIVRGEVQNAILKINQSLANYGWENFSQEKLDQMWQNAENRDFDAEYEKMFEIRPRHGEYYNDYAKIYEYDYETMSNQEDKELDEDYKKANHNKIMARLDSVKKLRHEAKKEKMIKEEPEQDDTQFLRRHWLEYRENNPSPYTPTLGIEIEVREEAIMPREVIKDELTDEWPRLYNQLKTNYKETEKLIPHSYDKFWEFSHKPAHYYLTLSREVQALIEMNLLPKDYKRYPLHLTLGGITSEGEDGQEAFVLARALEATGWSVTGKRLLRPYRVGGWTGRGDAGVNERDRYKIELGMKKAVELRTFQLQSLSGLNRLLCSAFLLGTALRAYQKEYYQNKKGLDESKIGNLERIWYEFSKKVISIFIEFDLENPSDIWKLNRHEPLKNSPFFKLAEYIDSAADNPNGTGAQFVAMMRKLIIDTRSQVEKIIYQD